MNLAFFTLALRDLCVRQTVAERQLNGRVAKKLRERLADLRAAERVTDLVAGRPRQIPGGRHSYYAVTLADGYRLVFSANHERIPLREGGGVDWSAVTRVMIRRVERTGGDRD